jgi:uncharacterized membrane protein YfcA
MALLTLLGAAVGLLLGLTGAGGGILAAPLLILVAGLPPTVAVPIALAAVALAAATGAALGLRERVVRYRAAALMAGSGLLVTPMGVMLATTLPAMPLLLLFAALLVYRILEQWRARPAKAEPLCPTSSMTGRFIWSRPCARALALAGAEAGFLSGLLGVGGGFILVPALRRHTDLAMHAITATSLMVLAVVSGGSLGLWLWSHGLPWQQALPFIAGALLGLAAGRLASPRVAEQALRQGFAALSLLVAAGLLWKALAGGL